MSQFIVGHCSFELLDNWDTIPDSELKVLDYMQSRGLCYYRAMLNKPRTNPKSWQGCGIIGKSILLKIKSRYKDIKIVSEVVSEKYIETLLNCVDVFQIGARNSQNFELLKELGKLSSKTFLYKRGFATTLKEWLEGMEYLNPDKNNIIMCSRGIRTFDTTFRFSPDFDAIIALKDYFKDSDSIKVGFDPSHSAGSSKYVIPLSKAALSLEVDYLEVEIHHDPTQALSDGAQNINFEEFDKILEFNKIIEGYNKNG